MDKLLIIEQKNNILLPTIYKDFFNRCAKSVPDNLVGTDLLNNHSELNSYAKELLQEDGLENFLDEKDIVFMMHQGYIFWYFKADGNPDPIVYGYSEKKLKPDNCGFLSEFVKQYMS